MSKIKINISSKVFNKPFIKYIDNDKRYLIFYGGSGSGKSYFVVQRYIYRMLKHKRMNLLVVRNTGKTNRDSTFALFKQIINKWNLSKYFKINESDLRIRSLLNTNEIIFAGLDDVEKLKSITFSNGELTDIWVEEASEILESDFNQLDLRMRGKGQKKQIVISFNPIDINHWLKKRFFDCNSDDIEINHSTYLSNSHIDDAYKQLLESYKDTDEYYYSVYCLGKWGVLGKTVFDAKRVQERLQCVEKPIKTGYFTYDYDGLAITNIKWITDRNGYVNIYHVYNSPKVTQYCIGGDTAGEGSDFFTAQVLDARSGAQVATLRNQFDADLYAKQMYCLGKMYGDALIGIESNFDSFPIRELERLGYKNQYIREKEDTYTGAINKSYGFRTTAISRPRILSSLIEIVREHAELLNDKTTLEEMLTFVRNEKGRPEAQQGAHDDLIMALAIAYDIKEQVIFNNNSIKIQPQWQFEREETHTDYGETIKVI